MSFEESDSEFLADPIYASGYQEGNHSNSGVGFGMTLIHSYNGTTTYHEEYDEERNWVVVGVLVALIVMLWCILGGMLCYPLIRFIRRRMPVSKRRINRRYETIEGWLITKVVRPHDDGCDHIHKNSSADGEDNTCTEPDIENQATTSSCVKHAESYETELTAVDDSVLDCRGDDRECPVCMEPFAVGDIVSWSSYEKCKHVYHHQCIKEWLLRHNNCPFCREIFLPVDQANVKITVKVFRELSELRARRSEKTYYCVQDGLVTLDHPSTKNRYNKSNATTSSSSSPSLLRKCGHIKEDDKAPLQLREKLKPGVTKADLKKLRGDRTEKICYGGTVDTRQEQAFDGDHQDVGSSQPDTAESPEVNEEDPTILRNDSFTTASSGAKIDDDDEQRKPAKVVGVALGEHASDTSEEDDNSSTLESRPAKTGFYCATSLVLQEASCGLIGGDDDASNVFEEGSP